ncbi:MAG: DNA polymerase III subunit alpha [Planctomycetes bacterium]|nr:DNA polymerase III subunit alpha [Planctomycetota bacterium]MBL7038092.1 DNA polymerase III subunit alpha [Pirellulaceae bacterium]
MSDRPFVHLHCHSHYSLLDGASSIKKLIGRAKDHGMNALALTDHGNLHGALEFYQKAKAADLNPIVGYEAYIASSNRHDKDSGNLKEAAYHLTLLAQNRTGFENLVRMASTAYLEGFYFKPRIDKELLQQHNEGIICLSGCVSSELNRALLKGHGGEEHLAEAMEIAKWFHDLFGDRYFIEIMNNGVDVQRFAMEGAVEVANRVGVPLVATSDCHYVDADDAEAQDVMLCINTGKFRTDTSRMRMDGNEYYLRTPDEMYAAFPGREDAVARSQEIADSVDINLELGQRHFPTYAPLPEGETSEQFLRRLCLEGLRDRYAGNEKMCPGGELSDTVMERLDRELSVINNLGFPNYFLIVWDFVREARDMGVPTTARGSGVGAIVCYALYLSHVCPIEYDLLFERFLDENRLEAPDIDIDFCKERRADVMRYVKDKYGEDNVAQIGTFGTLQARAAIKDVGRTLGIPLARVNEVTAMVPEELHITLEAALKKSDDLHATYQNDGEIREMIDLARKIEGLARNIGTHAAAVVIADKPLTEYVPLSRISGKEDIITQWSMNDVEAAGLLKMDFLGLRNLTILRKTVDLIEQTTGERIDPQKLPTDDPATYALLQRGETKGVFQLESGGIRDLLQRMKPDHFLDIIATNALYRPGPLKGGMVDEYVDVKHGRKQPQYKHPVLEEVLKETHGVMVYQEQIMRILNRLGGIELAKAYTCIKAISKKKKEIINANHDAFISGSTANGLGKKDAQDIWDLILEFAGYGFNKSHSTAYALIAYQTAYLKTHYPVEFMAALLSSDIPGRNFKKKDSLVEHMDDSERMKIEIVHPDVNSSDVDFSVGDGKIYFALSAIKGCGGGAADAIVVARKDEGSFKDLFDFCERVDASSCNRSTIETLIKAGAMDSFGVKRSQLLAVLERAMQSGSAALADRRSGQRSLFGEMEDEDDKPAVTLPDIPELPERERSLMEKEVLGYYRTSHPLAEYEQKLAEFCSHTTAEADDLPPRTEVIMGGMLAAVKLSHVKKTRPGATATKYANFDLEDKDGVIRCILWPDEFATMGELVQADAVLVARGKIDRRGSGDGANLIVDELIPLDELESRYTSGMIVCIDEADDASGTLKQLYEIIRGYPGSRDLQFMITLNDGSRVRLKSNKVRVNITPELRDRVDDLLGPGSLRLIMSPPTPSGGKRNGKRRNGAARGA